MTELAEQSVFLLAYLRMLLRVPDRAFLIAVRRRRSSRLISIKQAVKRRRGHLQRIGRFTFWTTESPCSFCVVDLQSEVILGSARSVQRDSKLSGGWFLRTCCRTLYTSCGLREVRGRSDRDLRSAILVSALKIEQSGTIFMFWYVRLITDVCNYVIRLCYISYNHNASKFQDEGANAVLQLLAD